jgi:hypothetical protein
MAERKVPKKKLSKPEEAKLVVEHKAPIKANVPEPSTPSAESPRAFVGYSKKAKPVGKFAVELNYRSKLEASVEQRRYYAGSVQVAYVRVEGDQFKAFLTNGSDAVAINGVAFNKEGDLNKYLQRELAA